MNGWLEAILLAAFVAGLMGGAHCAAMCAASSAPCPAACRWAMQAYSGVMRWLITAGGIFSYAVAGALAGALGQADSHCAAGRWRSRCSCSLPGDAVADGAVCGRRHAGRARSRSCRQRRVAPHSTLFRWFLPARFVPRALGWRGMGWLRSGMVYAVLLTAMATADARRRRCG